MTDLRRVDVNLIVVLDAILAEKNLTRAAEAIGMTQPTVSGALARLRQQFDDPILVRSGRGFELTEKAVALQPAVRQAMIEISRTLALSPTFDPLTSTRTFLVSASDYVLSQLTSPLLGLIAAEAPGVRVEFDSLPANELGSGGVGINPADLLRRDVMIVGTGRGVPGKHQSLFSDSFVCIAAAGNPRLRDGALTLDDIAALRHVRASFGQNVTTHVDASLAAVSIDPDVGITVQGFLPVPFAVSGTQMIGFVPERIARQYEQLLNLVIVETPLPPPTLVEAVYWHPSKTSDAARQWLVSRLRRAAEIVEFGVGGFD